VNENIPPLHCYVRERYITADRTGLEEAYAFGICSMKGRALGVHAMLKSGAHYRNLPLAALCIRPDALEMETEDLAYWDCFTNSPEVTVFEYLRDHECIAYLPCGEQRGVYLFTVDWLPDSAANPGFVLTPDQNKCGHVLVLESGNLAMLPTNKIAWRDGFWIGHKPEPKSRKYKVTQQVYQAESADRDFSKSDLYYY